METFDQKYQVLCHRIKILNTCDFICMQLWSLETNTHMNKLFLDTAIFLQCEEVDFEKVDTAYLTLLNTLNSGKKKTVQTFRENVLHTFWAYAEFFLEFLFISVGYWEILPFGKPQQTYDFEVLMPFLSS